VLLSDDITKWYTVDAVYKSIILIPKIITAVSDSAEGFAKLVFITRASNPIKESTAPAKWVNPLIGSLRYLSNFLSPLLT